MERDHDKLADELEREQADMEHLSEQLGSEIDATRDKWRRRQKDPGVPGAEPPHEDDGDS
jgi:hypothetical protein